MQARSQIRIVQLHMELFTYTEQKDWKYAVAAGDYKYACAWLGWLLPALRRVEVVMNLQFVDSLSHSSVQRILAERAEKMILFALDSLSPFQDSEAEVLRIVAAKDSQEGQKGGMVRDMDARVQSGIW